jgi:glutathione S-transferase
MNFESIRYRVNLASSTMATALRTGMGISAEPAARKPEDLLEIYDIEGSPYCRLVREALTELDIDAMIYPCPHGGTRFRPRAEELGGKRQFPLLIDPNTGVRMYESLDIVEYLFDTYADRPLPIKWRAGTVQLLGSTMTDISRCGSGIRARTSAAPAKPLELYSFESSPFARMVRDTLCELEIPYTLRSAGRTRLSDWVPPVVRDSLHLTPDPDLENRKALLQRAGRVSIPYLVDPNTGTEMGESMAIVRYLNETYGSDEGARTGNE